MRVVAVEENGVADVDVFTYADASADPRFNRRGQLLEQHDNSGTLRTDSFALTGQPLAEIRTFDDGQGFTSRRVFSPMGAGWSRPMPAAIVRNRVTAWPGTFGRYNC